MRGVWGPGARGCIQPQAAGDRVDVCMGTLTRTLGSQGVFVCGSTALIQWGINRARAFIYSTALSPGAAGGALAALAFCENEENRRIRLFSLSDRLWTGLGLKGKGPIVPLILGGDGRALSLSAALWEGGVFAPAVRFPTVPKGAARVRFSVTASHTPDDIDRVLAVVNRWTKMNGQIERGI